MHIVFSIILYEHSRAQKKEEKHQEREITSILKKFKFELSISVYSSCFSGCSKRGAGGIDAALEGVEGAITKEELLLIKKIEAANSAYLLQRIFP